MRVSAVGECGFCSAISACCGALEGWGDATIRLEVWVGAPNRPMRPPPGAVRQWHLAHLIGEGISHGMKIV